MNKTRGTTTNTENCNAWQDWHTNTMNAYNNPAQRFTFCVIVWWLLPNLSERLEPGPAQAERPSRLTTAIYAQGGTIHGSYKSLNFMFFSCQVHVRSMCTSFQTKWNVLETFALTSSMFSSTSARLFITPSHSMLNWFPSLALDKLTCFQISRSHAKCQQSIAVLLMITTWHANTTLSRNRQKLNSHLVRPQTAGYH